MHCAGCEETFALRETVTLGHGEDAISPLTYSLLCFPGSAALAYGALTYHWAGWLGMAFLLGLWLKGFVLDWQMGMHMERGPAGTCPHCLHRNRIWPWSR